MGVGALVGGERRRQLRVQRVGVVVDQVVDLAGDVHDRPVGAQLAVVGAADGVGSDEGADLGDVAAIDEVGAHVDDLDGRDLRPADLAVPRIGDRRGRVEHEVVRATGADADTGERLGVVGVGDLEHGEAAGLAGQRVAVVGLVGGLGAGLGAQGTGLAAGADEGPQGAVVLGPLEHADVAARVGAGDVVGHDRVLGVGDVDDADAVGVVADDGEVPLLGRRAAVAVIDGDRRGEELHVGALVVDRPAGLRCVDVGQGDVADVLEVEQVGVTDVGRLLAVEAGVGGGAEEADHQQRAGGGRDRLSDHGDAPERWGFFAEFDVAWSDSSSTG